mmetsp:Transcript_23735/g.50810  ORF Transcript_23735/g.50810 Transcript_23735/m.50810 type:complete len:358 (-) Transcript_23735:782-1855(-)|eukprot:CAMPEP_0172540556 /NCGR_PEP_ID=MMETSP1067-20121228/11540_1 /TAXON_ID=265564 ORGANISM="Thalassiosira punctigera, Strain Tpunct2005C2" /NCGR_SAMPLE_ID=MMETSP1067 /ASSEMBLY_ACC=CAM_ASM_000444 /LENGTH=357 /DNA_ID=CAMNT_0013326435 /DNA_START=157 /DNA_END=1230 /DNA_ORIENTATION=-
MEDYTEHRKAAILLMKTGGLLSMIASHFIARDVFRRYHRGERIRLTSKIVFELSVANFWASFFSAFMSTWMVPKESGAYQAAGNTASCSAQGFLNNFLYGLVVLMNTILALTYCIIVKRGRRDEARSRRSLLLILGLPPTICFLLACKPLFDKAYNYTDFYVCGIAEHPLGCLSENSNLECTRGSNAREIKITRFTCICLANTTIVVSVCVLIAHVISTERRMTSDSTNVTENTYRSMKVTWQGICYVAAFWFSWGPWYIWQWIRITSGMLTMKDFDNKALLYIISITHPLQGVANAYVYFRPRYKKFRERDSDELRLASALRALDLKVPNFLSVDWWRALRSKNSEDDDSCDTEHL